MLQLDVDGVDLAPQSLLLFLERLDLVTRLVNHLEKFRKPHDAGLASLGLFPLSGVGDELIVEEIRGSVKTPPIPNGAPPKGGPI